MKLENFKDENKTKRKKILISIGVITIIGTSLLLYKTFASFKSEVTYPMMNDQINYYGDDNVYFAFYNGDQELDEMPQKGNSENLVFDHADCENGATVKWKEERWAPLVKNLTKSKTKCTLYFSEKIYGTKLLEKREENEKLKEEPELMYDDTDDGNLRYVGSSPNNYIDIGDRDSKGQIILWRIIGVMKNVTVVDGEEKQEDLIKIIRADSIGDYSWDSSLTAVNGGSGVNEWSQADIMKLLNPESVYTKESEIGNSLYWNNGSGQCYSSSNNANKTCDFTSNGISEEAKNKIAKVRWNTGTFETYSASEWTANATYYAERSENNGKKFCEDQGGGGRCNDAVDRTTTWDGYIGLMYPSDFGYAVGKSVKDICLKESMYSYRNDGCNDADWLKPISDEWTLTPIPYSGSAYYVFYIPTAGYLYLRDVRRASSIRPVAFLKSSISLSNASGESSDPFVAS